MEYEIDETESVSDAVVSAVSQAEDRSPLSLSPLYESVDPDALDAVFSTPGDGASDRTSHVSFTYSDSRVTVDSEGTITIETRVRTTAAGEV